MYVFGGGLVHPTTIMYFGSNENIAVGCLQWTLMSGILNCMLMLQTFLPFSSIIRFVFICYKRTVACISLSNAWEVTGGRAVSPLCRPLIMLIQTEGSIFPSSARGRFITSSCRQMDSASVCLLSRDSRLKSWHRQLTLRWLAPDPRHGQLQTQSPELRWHEFQPCHPALCGPYSQGYCSMSVCWAATTEKKEKTQKSLQYI